MAALLFSIARLHRAGRVKRVQPVSWIPFLTRLLLLQVASITIDELSCDLFGVEKVQKLYVFSYGVHQASFIARDLSKGVHIRVVYEPQYRRFSIRFRTVFLARGLIARLFPLRLHFFAYFSDYRAIGSIKNCSTNGASIIFVGFVEAPPGLLVDRFAILDFSFVASISARNSAW